MTSHIEHVNGIDLHYATEGAGDPLLLLHGFTGCGANWKLVFPSPPAGFQLLMPDLRGHGASTGFDSPFTFRQAAEDVLALLDRLGIERVRAIGLSGGGQVLLHVATQQPHRILAMVLVSTAHYFPEPARRLMRATTIESRTDEDWRMMREWHRHGDEQIRSLWRHANALQASVDDVNFSSSALASITARTLIVHGDRDPLYPVDIATEMHASIPQSFLWVVPNGGHGPIFGVHAEAFTRTALTILRGEWPAL
jgi:pimeloyl-ACP methyl ester carboxylesterase